TTTSSPSVSSNNITVWAYLDGARKAMNVDDARSLGFTIIDLSDDWVPYIFWPQTPGKNDFSPNEHLDHYVALANDRLDVDGNTLGKGQHNYLEVYGIPPSLSVLRQRFLNDEKKSCFRNLDYELFKEYFGPVLIVDPQGSEREHKLFRTATEEYRKALQTAHVKTLKDLLAIPEYKKTAANFQKYRWRRAAIEQMKKRLVCEDMFGRQTPKAKPGEITWAIRNGLRLFEQKHRIYGSGMISENTSQALNRTPLENNFESLKRALVERTISASGILEDGTASGSFVNATGQQTNIPNLVEGVSEAIIHHMGLTDPNKAMEFIKSHKDFERLFIAIKLPQLPEYYSDHMDLSVVVDRGDVWYDFPFDAQGKRKAQPRRRLPYLTLFVQHNQKKIPLIRWRTTVGAWQPEMRGNQEYYKYKISDVGPRIWQNIVAGPVWVPPKETPSEELVKIRSVRGRHERVVAQTSFGPGYASAYGLVVAFHVTANGHDNMVRTHGSGNYMSIIQGGHSHGCHRLLNIQAVRLFSFVLRHRKFIRKGQAKLVYNHRFEHRGEEFHINLHTRGYYYEMTPPVPVHVLEGRILGVTKEPILEYVKKPSVVYQEDLNPDQKPSSLPQTGAPRIRTAPQPQSPMTRDQVI
ncbi:MAG: hypothetical protein V1754_08320, partial [Pseudomonadota bacterium]